MKLRDSSEIWQINDENYLMYIHLKSISRNTKGQTLLFDLIEQLSILTLIQITLPFY